MKFKTKQKEAKLPIVSLASSYYKKPPTKGTIIFNIIITSKTFN